MKKGACCFASVSKGNILSPHWESNLRPLDSARDVLRLIHNELFGELGHHEVNMWIADKRTETLGPYEESNLDLRAGKMFRICSLWDRLLNGMPIFQSIHQQLQDALEEQESLKVQIAEYARQVARVEELLAQKVGSPQLDHRLSNVVPYNVLESWLKKTLLFSKIS